VEHPKDIGDRSTLAITLVLKHIGFDILMPFGENTRYDLVLESSSLCPAPTAIIGIPPPRVATTGPG
jgi:hypothetical protein